MTLLTRAAPNMRVRSIDEAGRKVTYVAATENGVETWMGKEYLRMSGARLERFQANPVFLDAHRHYEAGAVIGRVASIFVEARELIAVVEYAATQRAEEIWQLVKGGFLRAVSVGFNPLVWRELEPGATDGAGEAAVTGPGIVVDQWELYELSQVPIPADEDALIRRSFMEANMDPKKKGKRSIFSQATEAPGAPPAPGSATAAPGAPANKREAGVDDSSDDNEFDLKSALKGHLGLTASATDEEVFEAVKAMGSCDDDGDEDEGDGKADDEARSLKAQIVEIAPTSLRELAEGLVLEEGMTIEKARKRLSEEWARRGKPAGTPEPVPAGNPPATGRTTAAAIPDEDFARAFKR